MSFFIPFFSLILLFVVGLFFISIIIKHSIDKKVGRLFKANDLDGLFRHYDKNASKNINNYSIPINYSLAQKYFSSIILGNDKKAKDCLASMSGNLSDQLLTNQYIINKSLFDFIYKDNIDNSLAEAEIAYQDLINNIVIPFQKFGLLMPKIIINLGKIKQGITDIDSIYFEKRFKTTFYINKVFISYLLLNYYRIKNKQRYNYFQDFLKANVPSSPFSA